MGGKSTSDGALPISVFERIFRSYTATGFLPILLTVLLVAFALFIPNFVAVQNWIEGGDLPWAQPATRPS